MLLMDILVALATNHPTNGRYEIHVRIYGERNRIGAMFDEARRYFPRYVVTRRYECALRSLLSALAQRRITKAT